MDPKGATYNLGGMAYSCCIGCLMFPTCALPKFSAGKPTLAHANVGATTIDLTA